MYKREKMRNTKTLKALCTSAVLLGALVACGGGGGGSPSLPIVLPPTTPTTPAAPTAADLIVVLDKVSLTNTGSDRATLTVTAVDASRNVVAAVPVSVAVAGGVFTPADTSGVTGTIGTYVGAIAIGDDKSNRLLRYTINSGSVTKTGSIVIAGVAIASASVPSIPSPGQAVKFTVSVKDSAGAAMPNVAVTASGIPGTALAPVQTSNSGEAVFNFAAPLADGTYPIAIESAGMRTSYDLRVLTSGSTTVPIALGPISGASAIANPVVVGVNTAGSTEKQSEIRALFVAADNKPISNVRVRFSITSTALPGASLSTGSTLVYSDITGAAKTSYIAPTTASPNNGVVIKACYSENDFAVNECPKEVSTRLTAAASPVNLTIGVGNEIGKTPTNISYIKKFEIQAVNSAGNYAADVPLSAVVDILEYRKSPTWLSSKSPVWANAPAVLCANEDTNRNGVLDTLPVAEDTNGDGMLTPRQSDVAIGFVGSNKTDASGLATIQLQYPQNVGGWLRVKITVTAGVSGSEGAAQYQYVLEVAQEDVPNGSFLTPPYGSSSSCTNAQ